MNHGERAGEESLKFFHRSTRRDFGLPHQVSDSESEVHSAGLGYLVIQTRIMILILESATLRLLNAIMVAVGPCFGCVFCIRLAEVSPAAAYAHSLSDWHWQPGA